METNVSIHKRSQELTVLLYIVPGFAGAAQALLPLAAVDYDDGKANHLHRLMMEVQAL